MRLNKLNKKSKTKIIRIIFCLFLFIFLSPSVTHALPILVKPKVCEQELPPPGTNAPLRPCDYTLDDFVEQFIVIANIMLGVVGSLALLFFVYGGFILLTSAGGQEQVTKGRAILVNSVIGLLIVFGSALLIQFAYQALGLKWSEEIESGMPKTIQQEKASTSIYIVN